MLIPHTQQVISLPKKSVGDFVNVEAHILGKYIKSYLDSSSHATLTTSSLFTKFIHRFLASPLRALLSLEAEEKPSVECEKITVKANLALALGAGAMGVALLALWEVRRGSGLVAAVKRTAFPRGR